MAAVRALCCAFVLLWTLRPSPIDSTHTDACLGLYSNFMKHLCVFVSWSASEGFQLT